jgi:hypothetical protein
MKSLTLGQMEKIKGSFDCSPEAQLSYIGGAGLGGAFGGPFGFLAGLALGTAYSVIRCYK